MLLSLRMISTESPSRLPRLGLFQRKKILIHGVLQGLAGLKGGDLGGGDGNVLAGLGVAAHALGADLGLKGAEAHDLHLLLVRQGLGDEVDGGVQADLHVLPGKAGLFGYAEDQFSFVHVDCPFSSSVSSISSLAWCLARFQ